MLTIYGVYRSRALRPLWLLAEIGAPFTHVPVIQSYRLPEPLSADAPLHTASAEFLAVNPMAQVPACRDGALLLTESLAICLHIARKYGGTLGPATLDEAAEIDNWALMAATAIEPFAIEILYAVRDGLGGTAQGDTVMRNAAAGMARPLGLLNAHLGAQDWLMNRFTVADICVAECLRYGQVYGDLLTPWPNVARWMANCHARPAFQTVMAARQAEPE